jgi:hypothetical protein
MANIHSTKNEDSTSTTTSQSTNPEKKVELDLDLTLIADESLAIAKEFELALPDWPEY